MYTYPDYHQVDRIMKLVYNKSVKKNLKKQLFY